MLWPGLMQEISGDDSAAFGVNQGQGEEGNPGKRFQVQGLASCGQAVVSSSENTA